MSQQFFDRIGYGGKLDSISGAICSDYGLGQFRKNKLVLIGYEDFNFTLETSKGKYFVKVFAQSRTGKDCRRYVDIMEGAVQAGVSTPALLKSSQGYLFTPTLGRKQLRLCVTNFIDGKNLFQLGKHLSEEEIKFLAQQAARINQIGYNPPFIYDSWAITNFPREYKEKGGKLGPKDEALVGPLVKQFKAANIETLPHCFVHGDITSTNTMRDKGGRLHIIDFSCSNHAPRIQELAVLACDVFFDSRKDVSQKNLEIALKEYQKRIKLTPRELAALPMYIRLAHAMHVLRATYEKIVNGNNTKENKYFLEMGRHGLEQMIS